MAKVKFQSNSYLTVQDKARELSDNKILRRIEGVDLFAKEAHFHERCRAQYNLRQPPNPSLTDSERKHIAQQKALDRVASKIKCDVIEKDEVLTLSVLKDTYVKELCETEYCDNDYPKTRAE